MHRFNIWGRGHMRLMPVDSPLLVDWITEQRQQADTWIFQKQMLQQVRTVCQS